MTHIPYELLFGVDIAVKKLRPNANFQLEGTNFTQWSCPDNTQPPAWDEVMAQLAVDQQAYEEWKRSQE
jgi:hypothetical protein